MDYHGQQIQPDMNRPFFTDDFAGTSNEDLNLNNASANWDGPSRGQSQNIGQEAINGQPVANPNQLVNLEAYATTPDKKPDFGPPIPELAQVENVEPVQTTPEAELKELDIDQSVFEQKGERPLGRAAIKFMEDNEKEMAETKNVDNFTDIVNQARKEYKKNFGSS